MRTHRIHLDPQAGVLHSCCLIVSLMTDRLELKAYPVATK